LIECGYEISTLEYMYTRLLHSEKASRLPSCLCTVVVYSSGGSVVLVVYCLPARGELEEARDK